MPHGSENLETHTIYDLSVFVYMLCFLPFLRLNSHKQTFIFLQHFLFYVVTH